MSSNNRNIIGWKNGKDMDREFPKVGQVDLMEELKRIPVGEWKVITISKKGITFIEKYKGESGTYWTWTTVEELLEVIGAGIGGKYRRYIVVKDAADTVDILEVN